MGTDVAIRGNHGLFNTRKPDDIATEITSRIESITIESREAAVLHIDGRFLLNLERR